MDSIPIVDFSAIWSGSTDLSSCPVVEEIHSAFSTVGFVFLKNHGIDQQLVDRVFNSSRCFFSQDMSAKKPFLRCDDTSGNDGYSCMEQERPNATLPGDLKELYDICQLSLPYPDTFGEITIELFQSSKALALKVLEVMGHGLKLEDPQLFVKAHQKIGLGSSESFTSLRLLYYPPLPPSVEIKPGQLRCGEHVDYGSITLLFQDPNGGLQVRKANGEYIDVPYIEGAVLVNLGALMQYWTGDKYLATPHRVLNPEDEAVKRRVRQSIAFFAHPDNDVLVETIDGSNKYPPVTAKEDTLIRMEESWGT